MFSVGSWEKHRKNRSKLLIRQIVPIRAPEQHPSNEGVALALP
jgi:hypothetical protein